MGPLRVAFAVVIALAFVAPTAAAAAARGELAAAEIAMPASARADTIGLTLFSTSPSSPTIELTLSGVAIQRIGVSTTRLAFPSTEANGREIDERASFERATATLVAGGDAPIFALRSEGAATATFGPAALRGVEGVFLANAASVGHNGDDTRCGEPIYCLDVFGAYEIAGDALAEIRGGALTLLLYGPTLRVDADGETREFASGRLSSQTTGPVEQVEDAWVVLRAEEASGSLHAPAAKLYAAAPTLRAPALEFMDARGSLRIGARDYRAVSDDVTATGDLVLAPGPVPPAAANGDGDPIYASSFTTRVSGDVQAIDLNAAPAFLDSPAEQAGFAALLALLVAGIAYAWQHIAFLGAALYTRLNKPDILDNEVRNSIYDIIRSNPGISAREVHRRSSQSWGTVVYHLRQLERHHLVVSRSLGRTRNYYENHGKYRGMEVQLACLQSERALALARAIAASPGITQEQLAAQTGYPQPTTSYYVRKLKQAGLVEEQREGRYARYVPHAELPRYIALSDRPDQGAAPPTGVQA